MAIEKAIEKVGVVGCGLMGSGIAQVAAQAGCQVTVREVSQQLIDKGLQGIEKNLARLVEKGTLSAGDPDHARRRGFGLIAHPGAAIRAPGR